MNKTLIIAEAGVNHNGNLDLAKKLVDIAVEAGVDIVKFQSFIKAENVASKIAAKADYQSQTTDSQENQLTMIQKLRLSEDDHLVIVDYCKQKNIKFLSTPFDLPSIDLLTSLGVDIGKIPSGEITNLPYLRKMGKNFQEIILSTGMSEMEEIKAAIGALESVGLKKNNITVLHCNTEYPTPFEDVNLPAMLYIKETLGVKVGYSDHTLGIEVPIAAVTLGAEIIEKHFTIDKNMAGPDHKASLEPQELIAMVKAIRNIEKAMSGTGIKTPTQSELKNKVIARRSIIAARNIKKGEVLSEENLTVKRPGNGINPMNWDNVIGRKAIKDFSEDELIIISI